MHAVYHCSQYRFDIVEYVEESCNLQLSMKIAVVSQICKSRLELIPNSTRCIENCVREIDAMTRCEVNVLYYLY